MLFVVLLGLLGSALPWVAEDSRIAPLRAVHLHAHSFGDSAHAWGAFEENFAGVDFHPVPVGTPLNFGGWGPPVALRTAVRSSHPGRWWLVSRLRTPSHWRIRLSGRDLGDHGDFLPFDHRIAGTTDLVVPLDLRGGCDTLDLLIWEPKGPAALQVELVPDILLPDRVQSKAFTDAFVLGYLAATLVAGLFLWNAVRERAFGWYCLYLLCAIGWFAVKRGQAFEHLWPLHPGWNPGASIALAHLAVGVFTLFLSNLLELRRHHPRQDRILRILAGIQFALSPLVFACVLGSHPLLRGGIEWLQVLMPLWLLLLLADRTRHGNPLARGILLSFVPLALGMVYGALVEFGMAPGGPGAKSSVLAVAALAENSLSIWVLFREIQRRERSRMSLERDFHRRVVDRTEAFAADLARELHDDIGQRTWALGAGIHAQRGRMPPEVADQLSGTVAGLHAEVRALSRRIHPPRLREGHLAEALRGLCQESSSPDATVEWHCAEPGTQVSETTAVPLFRVAQEAVSNALRHGKAATVRVALERKGRRLLLRIEDDGLGFEPDLTPTGFGLSGMESRMRALGGGLSVRSAPGKGCTVEAWVEGSG